MGKALHNFLNPSLNHDIRTILAEELATYVRRMSRIRVVATVILTAMAGFAVFLLLLPVESRPFTILGAVKVRGKQKAVKVFTLTR